MSSTEVNQTNTPKQKSTVRAVLLTSALSLAGVLAFLVVHEAATLPAREENRQLLAKIQAMDDATFEKSQQWQKAEQARTALLAKSCAESPSCVADAEAFQERATEQAAERAKWHAYLNSGYRVAPGVNAEES